MKKILSLILVAFCAIVLVSCEKEPKPGKLVGDVYYNDRPLVGVEVTFTGENGALVYTTIENGYFLFQEIFAGDYIVSCKYNGKSVASYLKNHEKTDNPSKLTIYEGELHTCNVIIPDDEDLGLFGNDDDDDDGEENNEE